MGDAYTEVFSPIFRIPAKRHDTQKNSCASRRTSESSGVRAQDFAV